MTVRAITVPMTVAMVDALRRVAADEQREPRMQAARLLRDALAAAILARVADRPPVSDV